MSSTFDHRAVFPVAPAATELTNPTPNILEQPGVDTPKPWTDETIKILRSTHTSMPDVRVATFKATECSFEVRNVDGEAVVVVTELEGCMLMIEGWQGILETVQVSGLDAEIAACHLGRQIEGIRKLMVKIGRPVVMNKNEAAFMKSLFSDENIAWMASVWRHLNGC